MFNRMVFVLISVGALLVLPGCSTVKYLLQAGRGQLSLINHSRPIEEVLKDSRTSPRLKSLLGEIASMKTFAETKGLKATRNYKDFVQLNRPAVVWVVSACEELRFSPMQWSFPIVGSFTYLGWFSREDAIRHGKDLSSDRRWDVYVRGAGAYSTLGWFSDPVLSTMISEDENALADLVNVILHESVHATLYVKDQSYFNESVASFVADRMTLEYLNARTPPVPEVIKSYQESQNSAQARAHKLKEAYEELSKVYESSLPEKEKRAAKSKILVSLNKATGGNPIYNNASLIQYRTYGAGQTEFGELFDSCGKDWKRFFSQLNSVKTKDFGKSQREDFGEVVLGRRCNSS